MADKLIFGCGYLGLRVARLWSTAGHTVHPVTRDSKRAAELTRQGYSPLVADVLRPATLAHLPAAETVLYAVGYDRGSGASIHEVYVNGLQNVLDALPAETGKLIYISSTGVYGQSQGEWVDEQSATEPTRDGGRACLAAERLLAAHRLGPKSIVLRMAGIYGPGRIPTAETIRRGEPVAAPEQGFLNLIHVDDAAQIVLAAEARAAGGSLYTVSDGQPVQRRDYYAEIARLLGAPAPRFAAVPENAPVRSRSESNKRVSTAKLHADLRVKLEYPSYREGLAAIVAAEASP
jgi:nucleoside-diphosphate-sugar epimerase